MPSSHDLLQDQHLHDLDTELRDLRKQLRRNLRVINRIAKEVQDRLAALEPSGSPAQAPAKPQSRRKTAPKRGDSK